MDVGRYAFLSDERRKSNRRKRILYILAVVIIGLGFGTLLFWLLNGRSFTRPDVLPGDSTCSSIPDSQKVDCHTDRPITEKECLKRGCCYKKSSDMAIDDLDLLSSSYLGVPSCFYSVKYQGYEVGNVSASNDGIVAELTRKISSGFPRDVKNVHFDVTFIDDATLRIKLTDTDSNRFEPEVPITYNIKKDRDELYTAILQLDGMLTVKRKNTNTTVFKTKLSQLVYSDQFLHLSTETSSTFLYGLGEQKAGLLRSFNWTRYTLFNQGDLPVPHRNLYGSHPFYLVLEPDGQANGVFLLNSNAMDAVLQPAPSVSLRTIGGILDFYIMLGPTPSDVIKQYTGLIGRPFMIPYWSLGFQLCKYGYDTLDNMDKVLQRNLDAGVPVDVQWNDIDFMDNHLDFTYDPINFKGLPEWVEGLHTKGMHYIAMVSPGVSNTEEPNTYPPYDDAKELDIFIKDIYGEPAESKVWNKNNSVYPDYSNPSTHLYWANQFERYHSNLTFDGVWLDMNEPLNFDNGTVKGCPESAYDDPQYLPGRPYPLRTLTICMSSKHNKTIHYNEHNLLAFREAHLTFDAMRKIRQKRPFIISRATFAGQGVVSGHWSGDLTSSWDDMRYTIPFMLLFNMYGMPMIGSDICGFRLNTTREMCARWQALGAFYPLSRNHNDFDTIEQDPAKFGGNVLKAAINNLQTRYYLLPYFYTLFHKAHAFGETTVRPLFFEFPEDRSTYDIDEQFLWGPALHIMPALHEGENTINPYYPKGVWYDFYTGEKFVSKGERRKLQVNITDVQVAVRGGYVLPLQIPANTTVESRKNDFDLLVALNENWKASGKLYWDDGDSLGTFESGTYNEIVFEALNTALNISTTKKGYNTPMMLNEVKLFGVELLITNVTVNGNLIDFQFKENYWSLSLSHSLLDDLHIKWIFAM